MKTKSIRERYSDFLKRQAKIEAKHAARLRRYFNDVSAAAADQLEDTGFENYGRPPLFEDRLKKLLIDIYYDATLTEAIIEHRAEKRELNTQSQKDIIEDLIGILRPDGTEGEIIRVWRTLLGEYLESRVLDRIKEINQTTVKRISQLIEKAVNQGEGPRVAARAIREDVGYNKVRSLAVARTESIRAMNQGRYLAALTSPYAKEKKWLASRDERTRASHRDIGRFGKWKPLQADFFLNGKYGLEPALYPCDSRLSAENAVNCRCSIALRTVTGPDGLPVEKGRETYANT